MKSIFLYFFLLCTLGLQAQTYIPLADNTDIDREPYRADLEAAAQELVSVFEFGPDTSLQSKFKVFDFGFYLHQSSDAEGIPESFERAKAIAARTAPYYLLFAKQSDEDGFYTEFLVDLKLPEAVSCIQEETKNTIINLLNEEANNIHLANKKYYFKYAEAEKGVMLKLKGYLEQVVSCCNARTQCGLCLFSPEDMTSSLNQRGFLEFDQSTFTIDSTESYNENLDFQSDFKVQITTQYGDAYYRWSMTDELNKFVENNTGAKVRTLYFNDYNCDNFIQYLNGEYPIEPTSAFGRNSGNSDYFEEIIILDIAGKQQVFFNLNSANKSEASALMALQHLAAGNRGALLHAMTVLELEKCANGDANTWKEVIETTQHFQNIGDRIESAWKAAKMESVIFSSFSSIAKKLGDISIGYGTENAATSLAEIKNSEEANIIQSFIIQNAEQAYVKEEVVKPIFSSYNLGIVNNETSSAIIGCLEEDYITISDELVDSLKKLDDSPFLSFISNIGEIININKNEVEKLQFATGGEFYEETGELIPIGTLTLFTLIDKNGNKSLFKNCGNGSYRRNCDLRTTSYKNPTLTNESKPIIVRPCYRDSQRAVNFVQIDNYRGIPRGVSRIPYDFLLEYFFDINGSNIAPNGKVITNFNSNRVFDISYENTLYLQFVDSEKSFLEYNRLSSFYLNGLSWIAFNEAENFVNCVLNADFIATKKALDLLNNELNFIDYEFNQAPESRSVFRGKVESTLFQLQQSTYFGNDNDRDQFFNIIPLFYKRVDVINYYQERINNLGDGPTYTTQQIEDARDITLEVFNELIDCEIDQLDFNFIMIQEVIKYIIINNPIHLGTTEEKIILTMINKVSEEQCVEFLKFLEKKISDSWIWVKLFNSVNNFIWNENGKELLKKITELYKCAADKAGSDYTLAKDDLLSQIDALEQEDYYTKAQVEKVLKHIVPFNYANIFARMAIIAPNITLPAQFYALTDVDVTTDGKMDVTNEIKTLFDVITNETKSPKSLSPFDPIILHTGSNFGITKEFKEGNYNIYPAVLFFYLNYEAEKKTTVDISTSLIDLATLPMPIGSVTKIGLLSRRLAQADKVSSILSLAATATSDDNQAVSNVLSGFSAFLGLTSLAGNFTTVAAKVDAAKVDKKLLIETIHKDQSDAGTAPVFNKILEAIENGEISNFESLEIAQKQAWKEFLLDDAYDDLKGQAGITDERILGAVRKLFNNLNLDVTAILDKVKEFGEFEKKITVWLERLWVSPNKNMEMTVVSAGKVEAKYNGQLIAKFDENPEVGLETIDDIADNVRGEKVKEISEDGTHAIVCDNGKCGLKNGGCFAAGTLVATPLGKKKIEDIQTGDYVYAYDEVKKDTVVSRVLQTMQKTWYRFNRIFTGEDTFLATPNHPFYIPRLKRYLQADSVQAGMRLLTLAGTLLTVTNVVSLDTTLPIYNFEVAEHHNYFVGEEGILVHNDGKQHCLLLKATIDELVADWPIEKQFELIEILLKEDGLLEFLQNAPHEHKTSIILAFDILKKEIPDNNDLIREALERLADDIRNESAIGDHLYGDHNHLLAWWINASYLDKSDYKIIVALTDDLKTDKGDELFEYLFPSFEGIEKPTERFFAWAVLNYMKNNQRLNNDLALIKNLSAKLEEYPQIFAEITNLNKKDLYYTAINNLFVDEAQWWYKYRIYRQHHTTSSSRNHIDLDDNFRQMVANLIGIDHSITNPNTVNSQLGDLFEADVVPRIGEALEGGFERGIAGLPNEVLDYLRTELWDQNYRIMVTEITCDISRQYPNQTTGISPRPDMLFFKIDETGQIDLEDVISWDSKLSNLFLDKGKPQRNLSDLSGTGKEIVLRVEDFGAQVFQNGSIQLIPEDLTSQIITLRHTFLIGTNYSNKHKASLVTKLIK